MIPNFRHNNVQKSDLLTGDMYNNFFLFLMHIFLKYPMNLNACIILSSSFGLVLTIRSGNQFQHKLCMLKCYTKVTHVIHIECYQKDKQFIL